MRNLPRYEHQSLVEAGVRASSQRKIEHSYSVPLGHAIATRECARIQQFILTTDDQFHRDGAWDVREGYLHPEGQ